MSIMSGAVVRLTPFDFDAVIAPVSKSHALYPLVATNGLIFPFTPSISETLSLNYDTSNPVHSNEKYSVYSGTENGEISLSNCVFTCDTYSNARYAMAAWHFFRSYTKMDFGVGDQNSGFRPASGRPPSPMWFSAMGKMGYSQIPVILKSVSITAMEPDIDMVPVPNPGSDDPDMATADAAALKNFANQLEHMRGRYKSSAYDYSNENVTYMPIKLTFGSISLTVQHAPLYWKSFTLDNYRSGKMLLEDEG